MCVVNPRFDYLGLAFFPRFCCVSLATLQVVVGGRSREEITLWMDFCVHRRRGLEISRLVVERLATIGMRT